MIARCTGRMVPEPAPQVLDGGGNRWGLLPCFGDYANGRKYVIIKQINEEELSMKGSHCSMYACAGKIMRNVAEYGG